MIANHSAQHGCRAAHVLTRADGLNSLAAAQRRSAKALLRPFHWQCDQTAGHLLLGEVVLGLPGPADGDFSIAIVINLGPLYQPTAHFLAWLILFVLFLATGANTRVTASQGIQLPCVWEAAAESAPKVRPALEIDSLWIECSSLSLSRKLRQHPCPLTSFLRE